MRLLAIDTGTLGCGYAAWDNVRSDKRADKMPIPDHVGVIRPRAGDPWQKRAAFVVRELKVHIYAATSVVSEFPEFRAGNAVGHAAAAGDAILMLAFVCGGVDALCDVYGTSHTLVRPSSWKGQLPKRVVEARIDRAIGKLAQDGTEFVDDAYDAVGIGLNHLGFKISSEWFAGAKG